MKKIILLLHVACLCLLMQGVAQKLTIVQGTVDKENVNEIFLYKVVDGEMLQYAATRVAEDKHFAFAIPTVTTGFYYLGDNIKGKAVYGRFYLKQGESVRMNISQTKYTLIGSSPENKLLAEWQEMFSDVGNPSLYFWQTQSTYVTWFPQFEALLPKATAFKKKINTKDEFFNQMLSFIVDSDLEFAAVNFLYTPRSAHPSKEEYPAYYSSIIAPGKYSDTKVLQLGDGIRRINAYAQYYCMNSGMEKMTAQLYQECSVKAINNDTLKGLSIVSGLYRYKSFEGLQQAIMPFREYFVTDSINARFLRYQSSLASYSKGEKGYNFSYPDINGKKVSLSDLKGQVVFIDTWATWCVPCRAQIPHLKKLEEEFKDKGVAFVSISVDVQKDFEKWKNFIKKEDLGGIQLFADGWSQFTQYYKITGIPRFLIFDKAGNIVNVDSPRPSEPKLKQILEELTKG